MRNLWKKDIPFPAFEEAGMVKGAEYRSLHTAEENGYHFLLGAAVIRHQDVLRVSWANSWRRENDDQTILAERCSVDDGKNWSDVTVIARAEGGYGRSHGVYFSYEGKLYVFCPRARYDRIDRYPDLQMEGYVLNENGTYDALGVVLAEDFWPMCEPIFLENGTLLMAGLKTDDASAAVALCDGKDITRWEMKKIPNPENFSYWGETTVLKFADRLLAVVRGGNTAHALVSESLDNGNTWSPLAGSNFPISHSKMYAGTLSTGKNYLIFSMRGRGYRDTLAIAVGYDNFDKIYIIRDGFDAPPKYMAKNEWCYPYAYEDTAAKKLYVVYAKNKEDCEMAVLPVENL